MGLRTGLSGVLALCCALVFPAAALAEGGLRFDHSRWDFGAVGATEMKEHAFGFKNAGATAVSIVSLTPSCGCTAAVAGKGTFPPGATGEIKVTFDPSGKSGHSESTVTVETDDGATTVLTVTAEVQTLAGPSIGVTPLAPRIKVQPEKIKLGKLKVGQPVAYRIVVLNTGEGDLFILGVPARNDAGQPLSTKPIGKGKKVEMTFVYVADKAGKIEDSVSIRSNDPKRPELTVKLSGSAE